jgi:choline dehydrogenase-like flavoprotein
MKAVVETQRFSKAVLEYVGGQDLTEPLKQAAGNVEYEGQTYTLYGSGHVVGTHRMGTDSKNSVVNSDLKTWDHHNLYLVGCGSMPTLGTSNPTLTAAAFAYRAVAAIRKELSNAH